MAVQFVDIDDRYAKAHTQVFHVADFVHHRCHVQQRLGRDAAHVQADTAQCGLTLDQDDLEPEVGRAEGGLAAAGACA